MIHKKYSIQSIQYNPTNKIEGIQVSTDYDPCCNMEDQQVDIKEYIDNRQLLFVPYIGFKINLCKTYNSFGQYTDTDYIESETHFTFISNQIREKGIQLTKYSTNNFWLKGCTESKLDFVQSYVKTNRYNPNINVSYDPQNCFDGIISNQSDRVVYVINGNVSNNNYVVGTGIIYTTYNDFKEVYYSNNCEVTNRNLRRTEFKVNIKQKDDWTIKAQVHECYNLGIAAPKIVNNSVFIERPMSNPTELFQRLSETCDVNDIERYSNNSVFRIY